MSRVCVIDVAGLSQRVLARHPASWLAGLAAHPAPLRPTFPAVPASVQASMTTGVEPGVHGVIGGGIYRRQSRAISLAERSNTLLNKKRFWCSRHLPWRPTASLVYWTNPLAGAGDFVIGGAAYAAGNALPDQPAGLYRELAAELGELDMALLHGPRASWQGAQWLASAAFHVWARYSPDIQWVCLPGLDFELQRHGGESPQAAEAFAALDSMAANLAGAVDDSGGTTIIVSDGGYVPVSRCAAPNVLLRNAGLLKPTADGAVDMEQTRAFAMTDHQVAHVFCVDEQATTEARAVLQGQPGIAAVRNRSELFCAGLGHDRAGELVALADADVWLEPRWWEPGEQCLPHAQMGYDPLELLEPSHRESSRVFASRGLVGDDPADWGIVAATREIPSLPCTVTGLPDLLLRVLYEEHAGRLDYNRGVCSSH